MVTNENAEVDECNGSKVDRERKRELNGYHKNPRMKQLMESNYDLALNFTVHCADDIDNPSLYPWVRDRVYVAVFSVHPGLNYYTHPAVGLPDPSWRERFRICLNEPVDNYAFISMEVVRLYSKMDPGASGCMAVVGRAQIPLPKVESTKKEGRYGLIRCGEMGIKAEGHIVVSMEFEKIYRFG